MSFIQVAVLALLTTMSGATWQELVEGAVGRIHDHIVSKGIGLQCLAYNLAASGRLPHQAFGLPDDLTLPQLRHYAQQVNEGLNRYWLNLPTPRYGEPFIGRNHNWPDTINYRYYTLQFSTGGHYEECSRAHVRDSVNAMLCASYIVGQLESTHPEALAAFPREDQFFVCVLCSSEQVLPYQTAVESLLQHMSPEFREIVKDKSLELARMIDAILTHRRSQ